MSQLGLARLGYFTARARSRRKIPARTVITCRIVIPCQLIIEVWFGFMYVHLKSFHTTSQCIEKTSQYHKIYWYKNCMTYSIGCVSKVILVNAYSICFFKFCHLKFLTIVKLFCPLSNILPGCAISFTYSNLFEAMQKDLSCAKLFDCGPKIFWTSRWNRH